MTNTENVKNVISIDLDYIMAPCIQLYNEVTSRRAEQVSKNINPDYQQYWSKIDSDLSLYKHISFDTKKLEDIKKLISDTIKYLPKNHVFLAKEHDSLLCHLCSDSDLKDYTYNVYNIDHHHDIYYHPDQKRMIENFSFTDCANWVWYLEYHKKLNNYYWIKNEDSKYDGVQDVLTLEHFKNIHLYKNISDLSDIKFDYLFLCKSPEYIPYPYHYIYEELKTDLDKFYNTSFVIMNGSYCYNGKSRYPVK